MYPVLILGISNFRIFSLKIHQSTFFRLIDFYSIFAAKTPEPSRTKKPLSKSLSTENEDVKSNSSSTTSMSKTPRKTPAQVKAKSAARKDKVTRNFRIFVSLRFYV